MDKVIMTFVGLFLGFVFVELTYRLANFKLMPAYILTLPLKLFIFALALFSCYAYKDVYGFVFCFLGFISGFFLLLILRGITKNGRPEGA